MEKYIKEFSDKIIFEYLEEINIKPKPDFPYVWKVGNKDVVIGEIEDLLRMAKLRVQDYEERMDQENKE